jgi:hypothetical protein
MNQENNGTAGMPAPQTIQYTKMYRPTKLFLQDLEIVLKDTPYVEAKKYFEYLSAYDSAGGIIPISGVNEFIRHLSLLPYKTILPMMKVLESKENFDKYFELVQEEKK